MINAFVKDIQNLVKQMGLYFREGDVVGESWVRTGYRSEILNLRLANF